MAKKARPIEDLARSVAKVAARGNPLSLEVKDPAKCAAILEDLADGLSFKETQRKHGVSWDTVSRLRARHCMVLEERRAMLAQDSLDLAEGMRLLQKEKMRQLAEDPEALAKTNLRDLTIPYGVVVDKYLAVMGENRVVVEHKGGKPTLEEAMAAIEEARAKLKAQSVEVEAVSVEPKEAEKA